LRKKGGRNCRLLMTNGANFGLKRKHSSIAGKERGGLLSFVGGKKKIGQTDCTSCHRIFRGGGGGGCKPSAPREGRSLSHCSTGA